MNNINILPIGSICIIKGNPNKVMIIGYKLQVGDKVYDYCSVIYPIGMLGKEKVVVFDKKDIKDVIFKGYKNNSFKNYKKIFNIVSKLTDSKGNINSIEDVKEILEKAIKELKVYEKI